MRPFDEEDKARQPLPPVLLRNETEIADFARSCHALCMRLLEALALSLGVSISSGPGSLPVLILS